MPKDSYSANNTSRNVEKLMYDPTTKTWVPMGSSNSGSSSQKTATPSTVSTSSGESTEPSQTDTQKEADKEHISQQYDTLTGELGIVLNEKTNSIKINDTIEIDGIGKNLSGLYLVTGISREISKDNGYSVVLKVSKNGFSDGVKSSSSGRSSSGLSATRPSVVDTSEKEEKALIARGGGTSYVLVK